jgi:hypothetical protein
MSIADVTEQNILRLIFMATSWSRWADSASMSPETGIAVAFHTSDPGDAGNMSTAETTYTGYGRASVARSAAGWAVVGGVASPVSTISFPAVGIGSPVQSLTHFSVGATGAGAQDILFSGPVSPPISTTPAGLTPTLLIATTITLD